MSSSSKLLSVVCQLGKVDEDSYNKEFSPLTNAEMKIEDDESVVSAGDPRDSPPTLSPSNSFSSISTELLEEEDEYLEYGELSESLKQFIDLTPPQSPDSPLPSLEACYSRPAGLVHNHLASYEINIHKNCEFCDTPLKQVGTDGSQAQECTCTPCRSISDTARACVPGGSP